MQLFYNLFRCGAMVSFACLTTITGISLDLPFLKSLIILKHKLEFMLPYFSFIVKYFSRGNSGVMPGYFYHDINKIEVTLMSL